MVHATHKPCVYTQLRSECCLVAEHISKIQRCYVLSPALQKWGIRTKRETPLGHTCHSTLLLDAQWALSVPHHFLFEATESLCQSIPWGLTLTTHTSQSGCKTMNISELRALEISVCLSVSSSPFSFLSFLLLDFSLLSVSSSHSLPPPFPNPSPVAEPQAAWKPSQRLHWFHWPLRSLSPRSLHNTALGMHVSTVLAPLPCSPWGDTSASGAPPLPVAPKCRTK